MTRQSDSGGGAKRQMHLFVMHEQFVLDYLDRYGGWVDCCHGDFHDAFHARFGGARRECYWGPQPVHTAMRAIRNLYRRGVLVRGIVSLGGNWQPGLPKWVYVYYRPHNTGISCRREQPETKENKTNE